MAFPSQALLYTLASNQRTDAADSASLSITANLTVAGRVKLNTLPANNGDRYAIASKAENANSTTDWSVEILKTGGLYYLDVFARNTAQTLANETLGGSMSLSTGVWYSFVGTITTSGTNRANAWKDGIQLTNTSVTDSIASIADNNTPTHIGNRGTGTPMDGEISDVRIWSRILSGAEILSYSTDPCNFTNGANLAAWWTLDGVYTDSSGNANTMTPVNSPSFTSDASYFCGVGDNFCMGANF